jgi:hypothetical protein
MPSVETAARSLKVELITAPVHSEDALPVDRVRRYLMVEKAFDETGVVDLQPSRCAIPG